MGRALRSRRPRPGRADRLEHVEHAVDAIRGLQIADPAASGSNGSYKAIVSPYISGFTVAADYAANRPDLAMEQIVALWGHMANSDPTGTAWEVVRLPDGTLNTSFGLLNSGCSAIGLLSDSAAHSWGTGATTALSSYVVGVTPLTAGYQSWQVKPYVESSHLTWAQGQVPTGDGGAIASRWELGPDAFRLTVDAPDETSGSVAVPTLNESRAIYMDGTKVWDGTQAVNGATATQPDDGFVVFTDVIGSHTWAWSESV